MPTRRMKLIIQIPCFDEEQTLPLVLADLPREVAGFDAVEWLIIDDGSRDKTIEVARAASPPAVPDTTSGFPAYNREAAIHLIVVSKFTYTLETIIQAGKLLVAVDHVPIRTNPKTRESRLFPSMWSYVRRNSVSIFRIYAQYEPLKVFMTAAALVALVAAIVWARFAYFYVIDDEGAGHVQSLILGAVLFN